MKKLALEKRLKFMTVNKNGLQSAISWTLACSRGLGLLPLSGVLDHSSQGVRFTLKSFYTIIYLTTVAGQIFLTAMSFLCLFEHGGTLQNVTNALFYGTGLVTTGLLFRTAWLWPSFVAKVEELENKLPPCSSYVKKLCDITTFVTLFLALVEHCLSLMYCYTIAKACSASQQQELFFTYYMPWIFEKVPFALWKGILFEIFNIQSTFLWSYSDILIMIISIYLSEHFVMHYQLLKKSIKQGHFSADIFRMHYIRLVTMVDVFNSHFGIFIFTSFGFNLFWICTQLFHSLNKSDTGHIVAYDCHSELYKEILHGLEHSIYFSYSFFFLVARTLLVLLLAARVNSASIKPLLLMYDIHPSKYDSETARFVDQINNLKVAMSGLGFFYVTRTMILTLVGSIITYELVLLQFSD